MRCGGWLALSRRRHRPKRTCQNVVHDLSRGGGPIEERSPRSSLGGVPVEVLVGSTLWESTLLKLRPCFGRHTTWIQSIGSLQLASTRRLIVFAENWQQRKTVVVCLSVVPVRASQPYRQYAGYRHCWVLCRCWYYCCSTGHAISQALYRQ